MDEIQADVDQLGRTVQDRGSEPFDDAVNARRRGNYFLTLTHDGLSLTLWQWAERTGIHHSTLAMRVKLGWSVDETLTSPVRAMRSRRA